MNIVGGARSGASGEATARPAASPNDDDDHAKSNVVSES